MRSRLRFPVVLALVAALVGVPATAAGADVNLPEVGFSTQYICWETMPKVRPTFGTNAVETEKCEVRVGLSKPTMREVVFTYRTEAGSAKPQADYVDVREGKGAIVPGAVEAYITFEIVADRIPELEEFFTVMLLQVSGANIGRKSGTVTIQDSDQSKE
ncbi:Calx-beta domain-containing protein [Phytohabitans sp. LJ34]|uniref:Calx-beta domain-containing protein n=1 Tax=Phytohabitans sp. LJ34 TaxID=3452217 RepID=UPI003F8C8F09